MKRGEFDLEGFAVDCSGLKDLGDTGSEVFRALIVAIHGDLDVPFPEFNGAPAYETFRYLRMEDGYPALSIPFVEEPNNSLDPSDVLGQAAIDAAMDGATIVFEGDVVPASYRKLYFFDSGYGINDCDKDSIAGNNVVAYKTLKQIERFTENPKSFTIHKALTDDEICKVSGLMDEGLNQEEIIKRLGLTRESKADCPPSFEDRLDLFNDCGIPFESKEQREKFASDVVKGITETWIEDVELKIKPYIKPSTEPHAPPSFEELKHVDSDIDWDAREEEVYGDESGEGIEELLDSSDSDIIGRLIQELQFRHSPYSPSVLIDREGAVKLSGCGITIDVSACEEEDIGRYYDALTVLGEVV